MLKRKILCLLIPVCLIFASYSQSFATHLMGSDLTYRCSNDSFYFVLKVYRDCGSSVLVSTTGQVLNVVGGALNFNANLTHVSTKDITPVCSSAVSRCASPAGAVGFQEYTFVSSVYFGTPARAAICQWRVSWTLAARNSTITTGQADQNFFTFTKFNRCLAPCNTSPYFTDAPVSLLCGNQAQYINMSAIDTTDSPRDSISYHLDTAWQTATTMCSYASGLSPRYPMHAIGSILNLDSLSGTLQMIPIPNQIGVLVIAVKEWRKIAGVYQLISVIRRDIQINVSVCGSGRTSPILPSQALREVCPGQNLNFVIPVVDPDAGNAVTLSWSGNISGASFTSIGSPIPSGNFSWTPTNGQASTAPYYFSVLARDNSCPYNLYSTRTYYIKVKYQPFATITPSGPLTMTPGDLITLTATAPQLGYTYQWLKNNVAISGATSAVYTATTNGQYSVRINNTDNCPDTSNVVQLDYVTGISSYPYYESFELSNGGWIASGTNSSWTRSAFTMSKPTLGVGAANGSYAWYTNASGNYNNNETSYLTSPVFDMSTAFGGTNPVLSFNMMRKLSTSDLLWVEYNDGGVWSKLGTFGAGTNWYTTSTPPYAWSGALAKWHVASYIIPLNTITNKSAVQFRFVFSSNSTGNEEGIAIDDIHIHSQENIWTAATSVTNVIQRSTGTNTWLHFNSGGSRIISIKDNGYYLDSIRVSCYRNSGAIRSLNSGGLQYYLDRSWVIRTKNAPGLPVTVRLYLTHQEFNALDVADPIINSIKRMGITKYSGANQDGSWANNSTIGQATFIPHTSVTAVIPYFSGYILEFNVSSFSEFWVNSGTNSASIPLPVEWLTFTAQRKGKDAVLNWTTSWEQNNNHFEVERSVAGLPDDFNKLEEIAGKGSVVSVASYTYTDYSPVESGTVIYRLKQVDNNGAFDYSPVRSVNFDDIYSTADVQVAPNPFTGTTRVSIVNTIAQQAQLTITNAGADFSLHKEMYLKEGDSSFDVSTTAWPAGVYFLHITTPYWSKVVKLVKQ